MFSHAVEYVAGPNYGLHGERVRERIRALTFVPRPVVAADRVVTVMTRNVYHGVDAELSALVTATSFDDLLQKVAAVYQGYFERNFSERASALADLPLQWLVKASVPLGFLGLLLAAACVTVRNIVFLLGAQDAPSPSGHGALDDDAGTQVPTTIVFPITVVS